nr:hypothetical protein [uncultured Draconibacterium sp.]
MFPKTENTNGAPSPKDLNETRRTFGLSDFKAKMSQPKQEIKSSATPGTDTPPPQNGNLGADPTRSYSQSLIDEPEEQEIQPIDSEIARMTGKAMAGTVDNLVGAGLSVYAKTGDPEKYQANTKQLDQLENAWTAVAMKTGYNIQENPWLNLALLNGSVYIPKLQDAKADRLNARMDAMQSEFEKMQRKLIHMQEQVKESENKKSA